MRTAHLEGWPWLGAPLGVDLANSLVQIRPGHTRDLLTSEEELDEWLTHQDGRLPRVSRVTGRLAAFRSLRDALHGALSAAATGQAYPTGAIKAINTASARSDARLRLVLRDGMPTARVVGAGTPLDRALAAIGRSAIELLSGPDREHLRVCPAPSCGMFYLGRPDQEWCSTACGNRARAARLYARRRRTAS